MEKKSNIVKDEDYEKSKKSDGKEKNRSNKPNEKNPRDQNQRGRNQAKTNEGNNKDKNKPNIRPFKENYESKTDEESINEYDDANEKKREPISSDDKYKDDKKKKPNKNEAKNV